jgi:hypothetical protein
MAMTYTPASPSGLTPDQETALDPGLEAPPEMRDREEQDRVTGLLFDAAAKGDRMEFHRLWRDHVIAQRKVPASSTKPPNGSPK